MWQLPHGRQRTNEHGALARLGQRQGLRVGQDDRLCGRVVEVHVVQLAVQHLLHSGPLILIPERLHHKPSNRLSQEQLQPTHAELDMHVNISPNSWVESRLQHGGNRTAEPLVLAYTMRLSRLWLSTTTPVAWICACRYTGTYTEGQHRFCLLWQVRGRAHG